MKVIGILGAVVLVFALAVTLARVDVGREISQNRAVGTSGTLDETVIHELETITGMNDGHELVGRRVDLHVPVQSYIDDAAFWVGSADNRVLVVVPSAHSLDTESDDTIVAISGTVERVPTDQRRYSVDRPIYIRAETVTPQRPDFQAGTTP